MTVQARVGEPTLRIVSIAAELITSHRRAAAGAGQTVRTSEHADALKTAVLAAFTTDRECRRKVNRPPGPDALAKLARLQGMDDEPARVISLADYQQLADAAAVASR